MFELPKQALVVTAHPDDIDFGGGGTVAWLRSQGVGVSYCICTDGNQGGEDPSVSRDEMRKIRRSEQIAAGAILGVTDVSFLGFDDGKLFPTLELRKAIVQEIRRVKPDVVITQSPERNWNRIYSAHPDHLAAGEGAVQAVYPDARNMFAFPELLEAGVEPWTVSELWLMAHATPNHFVDITDYLPKKLAALKAHASQTNQIADLEERITNWGTLVAEQSELGSGKLAEGFFVVSTL